MRYLFISTVLIGSVYFIFSKRRFDLFSLAFFSGVIYFLPGFWGYALYPGLTDDSVLTPIKLLHESYAVMIYVVLAIFIGAFFFDALTVRPTRHTLSGTSLSVYFAVALALYGLTMTVITTGSALLADDKSVVLASVNRWYIAWTVSASVGMIMAFAFGRWKIFILSLCLVLLDVYIGYRYTFSVSVLAIFTFWANKNAKLRLWDNKKFLLCVLLFSFFAFTYKFLYVSIKIGDWDLVTEKLLSTTTYAKAVMESEPFVIQAILNEVIDKDFRVGLDHFFGLVYQFSVMMPDFGIEVTSFNDLFQPILFPNLKWGMANNIWAEMWSSGGWSLLIIFIFLFLIFLSLGSYLLKLEDPSLSAIAALLGSNWAFFIHRNDLGFQLTIERRILLIWLLCTIASMLLMSCTTKITRRNMPNQNGITD